MAEKYNLPRCVSIQNPYNLLNRHYEVGLSEVSMMEKVGLLAYSPMAFGLLSGKYEDGTDTSFSRLNQFKQMSRYDGTGSRAAAKKYIQLAKDHQLSPAQMSLAFINDQPFVTSNIIGATDMIQLKDTIESIQVKLTPEILKEINAIHEEIPNPSC
jgi:aryl-alcohol dehydrogenase-like predicted oxidoreductase